MNLLPPSKNIFFATLGNGFFKVISLIYVCWERNFATGTIFSFKKNITKETLRPIRSKGYIRRSGLKPAAFRAIISLSFQTSVPNMQPINTAMGALVTITVGR